MNSVSCDLCDNHIGSRLFVRRDYRGKNFCSIVCVEAFETRNGLPHGRVYESRPGWSRFPAVTDVAAAC